MTLNLLILHCWHFFVIIFNTFSSFSFDKKLDLTPWFTLHSFRLLSIYFYIPSAFCCCLFSFPTFLLSRAFCLSHNVSDCLLTNISSSSCLYTFISFLLTCTRGHLSIFVRFSFSVSIYPSRNIPNRLFIFSILLIII